MERLASHDAGQAKDPAAWFLLRPASLAIIIVRRHSGGLKVPAEKTSAEEAIRTAKEFEQAALDAYRELLETVSNDPDEDVAIGEFLREQVALESRHVAELDVLLED